MGVSRTLLVIGCLLCGTSGAYADKITFDTIQAQPDNSSVFGRVVVNGFAFDSFHAHVITNPSGCTSGCADNGTQWIGGDMTDLALTHVNATFSLLGFDAAESFTNLNVPATLSVLGTRSDATSVAALFNFDGINDSVGPLQDFQTFTLGSQWHQLTSVSFTTPDSGWFGIDNVTATAANPIPEPTSIVLLATGLAALSRFGYYRRH
jgi:hypothetical protein